MRVETLTQRRNNVGQPSPQGVGWLWVPAGAVAGLTLGIVARVWMRWISTDPEFSWSGTIAILVSFTIFGAAQSAAAVARLRPLRLRGVVTLRVVAVVLSAGLFGAAGAIMLPTVLFGSLAVWRSGAWRFVRLALAILAAPGVVFVLAGIGEDNGWGVATVGQMLLFVCIYTVIIAAMWPSAAPMPAQAVGESNDERQASATRS